MSFRIWSKNVTFRTGTSSVLLSYSFRSAALIFTAFCVTLVAVRLSNYAESLRSAFDDVQLIVNANANALDESIRHDGAVAAKEIVRDVLRSADDDSLYVSLVTLHDSTGNFPALSEMPRTAEQEVFLQDAALTAGRHLYVRTLRYPDGSVLMVGYSLGYVDSLKSGLPSTLFRNVELALLLTLALSLILVWLLNRHVHKFNKAFDEVRRGDLGYRMQVRGGGDQFDRLASNLNGMLDWLSAMLATSNDIGNSLAHDMLTPLSRHRIELRGLAEEPGLPAGFKERLDLSVEHLDQLTDVFRNILTISRAESGVLTHLFEAVDLTQAVSEILEFYEPMIEENHVVLAIDLPTTPCVISGDRQLLRQAILNLVDNAIKYTPHGGTILVSLRRDRRQIELAVADSGPGVDDELLQKLTQRFFRADASRHTPGTGLGLSLVEAVARLHHGQIQFENLKPGFKASLRLDDVDARVLNLSS